MSILFIGKKSRTTKHQLLPIYLRVTLEGKRFEVATHRHVNHRSGCLQHGLPIPVNTLHELSKLWDESEKD